MVPPTPSTHEVVPLLLLLLYGPRASFSADALVDRRDNQARRRHRRTICARARVRALPPPQSQEPHTAGFPSMPVAHAHSFDGLLKE